MPLGEVEDPLLWWSKHEGQFPTIAYLARTILSIFSSQLRQREYFLLQAFSQVFIVVDLVQRTWIS